MTLLAVYFIRILEYRNNVRQKANSSDFFYSCSKWVVKQQRQFTTPTTHLAQELLMTVQCSGGSRSFAKEMRALKMRSVVTGHWMLTMTNRERSSKLILLWERLPKNSTLTILWLFDILSKLERWKRSKMGCLMNWPKIFFKCQFEVSASLTVHNNDSFLNQIVMCDEKWVL